MTSGKEGLRNSNKETRGRLHVPLPINYLLASSLFYQRFSSPYCGDRLASVSSVGQMRRWGRWVGLGHLQKFPYAVHPSDVVFSRYKVLLWICVGLDSQRNWGVILIIKTSVCHIPVVAFLHGWKEKNPHSKQVWVLFLCQSLEWQVWTPHYTAMTKYS